MKTIIISDLHNRVFWIENFLSKIKYDRVVFLGDYFDDFEDTIDDIINVAEWLKKSLKNKDRIHLFGTHDLWYRFNHNPFIAVSGNTEEKAYTINNILSLDDWELLKLYHFEQDFLISHAGIHTYLISNYVLNNKDIFSKYIIDNKLQLNNIEIIEKVVKPAVEEAFNEVRDGFIDPWIDAGEVRGGIQPVGGIIWLDWRYEFEPIPYLNQIVGHTELEYPGSKITENSKNYNLDTRNRHIGILEDGKLTWKENHFKI